MSNTKILQYFDHPSDSDFDTESEISYDLELDTPASDELIDCFILELLTSKRCLNNVPLVISVLKRVAQVFTEERTLIEVESPVTVVGDIHGQFEDLLRVLEMGDFEYDELEMKYDLPEGVKFLFMGDYVDRGHFSIEVVMLLFCLKVKYPDSVFMLRGNHESRDINMVYGFADHCISFFNNFEMWQNFNKVFDLLPIAAVIDGTAFAVHGGLTPTLKTLDEIRDTNRFTMPLPQGLFEMTWSDPSDDVSSFFPSHRGAGYVWGEEATKTFLEENDLTLIIRAHELQMAGYKWQHDNKVLTIFSAPNYCYRLGNTASILKISEGHQLDVETFSPL
eukprot:TRINITY_DN8_c0_g1_i1.p1 TRINITY_DN8_c0_g1~~TRINITY_DN8_c0_g1_i1.p1  ORF type:complete len:335 (-),score=69.25 TRINITY_DN8_c0_g1_i1:373-1377(-)